MVLVPKPEPVPPPKLLMTLIANAASTVYNYFLTLLSTN